MSKLLKVREVITFKGWVDGSGWSYSQVYSDKIIDVTEGDLDAIDWDWYETDSNNPPNEGYDTKIIVDLYAEDADISEDEPLASHEKWASEIWAERHGRRPPKTRMEVNKMAKTLTLSKKQEEMLYLLRLDGLRREIELQEATEAYKKAHEIEKAVSQYVVDNNEYYISQLEHDMPEMKNGDRVTDEFDMCLVDEEIFKNDFLPKVKAAYMELYGIDNPLNFVYSSPMLERKLKAERAYRMIAVDFLKISGRQEEAAQLEKAIKGYLNPKLEAKLMSMIRSFIEGK